MPETHSRTTPIYDLPELRNLIQNFVDQYTGAQGALPTLTDLAGQVPGLQVPGLTPDQEAIIKQLEAAGTSQSDLNQARQQLAQLTSGPIGSSPETLAGMQAFRDITLPQIQQQQMLQGTGTGGAALEATALGSEAAAVPLIGQEIQNREAAVGQYAGLQSQQLQDLAASLEAAGLPRDVALQQAQAALEQQQGKFQFESGIQGGPFSLLPLTLGSQTRNWGTTTSEDIIGGIGKGLSVQGLFGGK